LTIRSKTDRRQKLVAQLAARKQASLAQLLFQAARVYNERALERMRDRLPEARTAHTRLMPYIDLDGTRQTVVAQRAGISKQAVGQLVDELVELGFLRREPDPTDGRALLVQFTDAGLAQMVGGFDVLDAIERALTDQLGGRTIQTLRRELAQLVAALERLP
jgi:DNA-binding MarR family transcriptional regulator